MTDSFRYYSSGLAGNHAERRMALRLSEQRLRLHGYLAACLALLTPAGDR